MANGGGGFGAQDMGVGEDVGAGFGAGSAAAGIGMDAAEIEAGAGGYSNAAELAGALADALEAAYAQQSMIDYGGVAVEDVAAQGVDPSQDFQQGQQDIVGVVEDFSGGYFGPTGTEDFSAYGQQVAPSTATTGVTQDFQQGQQNITGQVSPTEGTINQEQGYVFRQGSGQQGDPMLEQYSDAPTFSSDYGTYATPQASPYGASSQLGLTGHQFALGNPIGYMDNAITSQSVEDQIGGEFHGAAGVDSFTNMPMAESFTSPTQPEGALSAGMISAGTGPYGDPAGRVAKPGAITAGTVSSSPEDAATEAALAGQVITPSGVQDQIQRIPGDTTVTQAVKGSPEYHAIEKEQIDKSIITLSNRLDQEAKAAREKYGLFSREYQKAQRLANTFKSLDMYSKAYGATQGGSFLGNLLSGALPLGAALKGIQGWLTSKGLYGKVDIQQLEKDLRKASEAGTLDQLLRDLNQSGEGGMEAEIALQEEVSSFIQQYPWAAELDPKYIKYLIDNPAELQDLLGQNAGG